MGLLSGIYLLTFLSSPSLSSLSVSVPALIRFETSCFRKKVINIINFHVSHVPNLWVLNVPPQLSDGCCPAAAAADVAAAGPGAGGAAGQAAS